MQIPFPLRKFSGIIAQPKSIHQPPMSEGNTAISVSQLKKFLYELNYSQVHIRVRLMGQLWQQNFMHIVSFSDDGVLLLNAVTGIIFSITQISNIIQFEIDQTFKNYQPHFHYDVVMQK